MRQITMLLTLQSRTCIIVLAVFLTIVSLCNGFYLNEKEQVKVEDILSRSKRSTEEEVNECMRKDEDSEIVTLPDKRDCQNYYKCNPKTNTKRKKHCTFGYWYDDRTKKCEEVNSFSPRHRKRCVKKIGVSGTTQNIREVFIGRCWNYQLFRQNRLFPKGQYKNCTHLYELFHKAFANKHACGEVKFGAYADFLKAAHVNDTKDIKYTQKLLFWSGINQFSQQYSDGGKRLYTLENTLPGFLINELIWCGQVPKKNNKTTGDKDPGINFEHCPPWGICDHHPQVTFWEEASQDFASIARKEIHLMLNGSNKFKLPFRNNSFFANHELRRLNSKNVKKVNILVSHAPGVKISETCNKGDSISYLKRRLGEKGLFFTCEDNPADILHLLCTDAQDDAICKKKIIPKKPSLFNFTQFGSTVISEAGEN